MSDKNDKVIRRKCYKCQAKKLLDDRNFALAPVVNRCNGGFSWACRNCLDSDALLLDGGFGAELVKERVKK